MVPGHTQGAKFCPAPGAPIKSVHEGVRIVKSSDAAYFSKEWDPKHFVTMRHLGDPAMTKVETPFFVAVQGFVSEVAAGAELARYFHYSSSPSYGFAGNPVALTTHVCDEGVDQTEWKFAFLMPDVVIAEERYTLYQLVNDKRKVFEELFIDSATGKYNGANIERFAVLVVRALALVHAHGFVHHDITGINILVSVARDAAGKASMRGVHIFDYGMAERLLDPFTHNNRVAELSEHFYGATPETLGVSVDDLPELSYAHDVWQLMLHVSSIFNAVKIHELGDVPLQSVGGVAVLAIQKNPAALDIFLKAVAALDNGAMSSIAQFLTRGLRVPPRDRWAAADIVTMTDAGVFKELPIPVAFAYDPYMRADRMMMQYLSSIRAYQKHLTIRLPQGNGDEIGTGQSLRERIVAVGTFVHIALILAEKRMLTDDTLQHAVELALWFSPLFFRRDDQEDQFEELSPDGVNHRAHALAALRFAFKELHADIVPMSIGSLFLHSVAHSLGVRSSDHLSRLLGDKSGELKKAFNAVMRVPERVQTLYTSIVAPYYARSDIAERAFYPPNHNRHAPLFAAVYDYFLSARSAPRSALRV